jgi:hypothetical protein
VTDSLRRHPERGPDHPDDATEPASVQTRSFCNFGRRPRSLTKDITPLRRVVRSVVGNFCDLRALRLLLLIRLVARVVVAWFRHARRRLERPAPGLRFPRST